MVGKALLLVALGWAAVVSIWIGQVLAQDFGAIVLVLQTHALADGSLAASIAGVESYLALTYALLTIAYIDAFRRGLAGPPKSPSTSVAPPAV
jgi:hypothetical protein